MSHRKTKKQKIAAEKRINIQKEKIKELEELKTRALQLKKLISERKIQNFKQLNIRNLKVFANVCNLVAPIVLSTGFFIGGISLFGGGLPFHKDTETKYKCYNLDYQTNGYATMNNEYKSNYWFEDPLDSKLTIYTPWKEQDGQYVRFKREYELSNLINLDLYNAILNEDHDYISRNLKEYEEEKQIINEINSPEQNGYFIEANLQIFDKEDILKRLEDDEKNFIVTFCDLTFGLVCGALIMLFRNYDFNNFLYEVRRNNNNYKWNLIPIKPIEQELEEINKKILSLSKYKGDRI